MMATTVTQNGEFDKTKRLAWSHGAATRQAKTGEQTDEDIKSA